MTGSRRFSPSIAAIVAAAIVTASGLAYIVAHDKSAEARLIAFPSSFPEAAVVEALAAAGVTGVAGATTALVPLSDFSRVLAVPFLNAAERAGESDPRRTPLLEELGRRFAVPGPDGEAWRVIYVPEPSPKRDEAVAAALSGLGGAWAWDAPAPRGSPRFLWAPALAWFAWLAARKPRRGRLGRALLSLSWMPLLLYRAPSSAALFVVLEAATVVADHCVQSGARRFMARGLWPYAVAAIALVAFDPGVVLFLAGAIALFAAAIYFRPRLERLAGRNRLHEPPVFRALTLSGASANARTVSRAVAAPLAAILVMAALFPAAGTATDPAAAAFRLRRAPRSSVSDARKLLEEHMAFQVALTFGRIGDVRLGNPAYSSAYRYLEESGRMKRVERPEDEAPRLPSGNFSAAVLALSGGDPTPVTRPGGEGGGE